MALQLTLGEDVLIVDQDQTGLEAAEDGEVVLSEAGDGDPQLRPDPAGDPGVPVVLQSLLSGGVTPVVSLNRSVSSLPTPLLTLMNWSSTGWESWRAVSSTPVRWRNIKSIIPQKLPELNSRQSISMPSSSPSLLLGSGAWERSSRIDKEGCEAHLNSS